MTEDTQYRHLLAQRYVSAEEAFRLLDVESKRMLIASALLPASEGFEAISEGFSESYARTQKAEAEALMAGLLEDISQLPGFAAALGKIRRRKGGKATAEGLPDAATVGLAYEAYLAKVGDDFGKDLEGSLAREKQAASAPLSSEQIDAVIARVNRRLDNALAPTTFARHYKRELRVRCSLDSIINRLAEWNRYDVVMKEGARLRRDISAYMSSLRGK